MRISPIVIQTLDTNKKDISSGWLWSTSDVYNDDYTQTLTQPVSIEAITLNEMRWLSASTSLVIRAGSGTTDAVIWAGIAPLTPDPPVSETINVVNNITEDVTVTLPTSFYDSTFPLTLANTVTQTTLVPGIIPCEIVDQIPGQIISIKGIGTIQWNTLTDYVTINIVDGGVNLISFTLVGTDLKYASINTPYMLEIDLQIVSLSNASVSCPVQLSGTVTIYDDYVILPISINSTTNINTTTTNTLDMNAQWNNANLNNSMVIDKFKVCDISVISGTVMTQPDMNVDGGQFDTVYGGAIILDGGTL